MSTLPDRITSLEARQAELERRIADLERAAARQMPIPWTWPRSPYAPLPSQPNDGPLGGHCPVCNNAWKDMSHYVCTNDRCPNRVYCGDNPNNRPIFTCGGLSMATDQLPSYATSSTTKGALVVPEGQSFKMAGAKGMYVGEGMNVGGLASPNR